MIPVDVVADYCISSGYYYAKSNQTHYMTVAVGSSGILTWKEVITPVIDYFCKNPLSKQLSKPSLTLYKNKLMMKTHRIIRRTPYVVLKTISEKVGLKKLNRNMRKVLDFLDKAKERS